MADGKKCTSEPKYIILLHTNFSDGDVNDSNDAAWVLGPKWRPYGDLLSQKTWRFPPLVKKVSRFISHDLIRFHRWGFIIRSRIEMHDTALQQLLHESCTYR